MSQKNYAHFVITRFNIPANYAGHKNKSMTGVDPKTDINYLKRRMELFRKYTFPSLKNQTDQNFQWLVLFSNATPALIKEELEGLKEEFSNFCPLFLTDEESYNFDAYLAGIIGKVDAKAYITTRIDNDDAMNIYTMEEIHKYYESHPKTNVLISFPYGLQYMEEKKLYSNFHLFGNHFITLILPTWEKTVISFPHNKLPKEIEKVTLNGKNKDPMWIEIIHGTNYANQQSFHIGKALKSTKVFAGFSCGIEPLSFLGVIRNVILSIPITIGLVIKVLKKSIKK